ncbi:MAG: peptidyl-prolyl cis-trans isomerase [Deltaproteobacteria bacterium]|nr:peptidyl-prolyl cis-trans isomerase [Deltaproteobacteria bacterium]
MVRPRRAWAPLATLLLMACSQGAGTSTPAPKGIPYPKPPVATEGKVVAKIGDVAFTTTELEHRIAAQSPFTRVQLQEQAEKKRFVDNELRMELLAQEGWRRGIPEDPQLLAQFRRLVVQKLINDELKKLESKLEVTDADLAAAYEAKNAEFNKPEKVRVAQIVTYVDAPAARAAAKKALEKVQKDVLAAERKNDVRAFSRMAQEHSQDEATKMGGGDLNFLTRAELAERYGDDVAKFMFDDVKVGDMGIADAPNAVVLFKKTGYRRGVERSLEMVKPQLRGQVLAEKRTAMFDAVVADMMKAQGIDPDYSLLDEIKVDTGGAPTPRAPALDVDDD